MAKGGRRGRPRLNRGNLEDMEQFPPSPEQTSLAKEGSLKQQSDRTVQEKGQSAASVLLSFASLGDPNEGTALEFIPINEINGTKCAQLNEANIEEKVIYWQSAMICCVLGANPPYEVIAGYIRRIWSDFAIDKVLLIKKGLYLVWFNEHQAVMKSSTEGGLLF